MDELRYRRAKMLKDLMANPLFNEAFHSVLVSIAAEMLMEKESAARDQLYYENLAVGRMLGRLQAIANEVIMAEHENRSA